MGKTICFKRSFEKLKTHVLNFTFISQAKNTNDCILYIKLENLKFLEESIATKLTHIDFDNDSMEIPPKA